MQTLAFASALDDAVARLRLRQIVEIIAPVYQLAVNTPLPTGMTKRLVETLFVAKSEFGRLQAENLELSQALGLATVLSDESVAHLIALLQTARFAQQITNDSHTAALFYRADAATRLNTVVNNLLVAPRLSVESPTHKIVAITIEDYDGRGVQARRVALVASALADLYDTLAHLFGITDAAVRVAYVDSGSAITVGVEGVTELIDGVRSLFETVWSRIRYRDNDRLERNMETALKGVDFVATIRERASVSELDSETAAKLEAAVNSQMVKLVGAGAMLQDVSTLEEIDRKEVLARHKDVKLLGTGE